LRIKPDLSTKAVVTIIALMLTVIACNQCVGEIRLCPWCGSKLPEIADLSALSD
jgi:hypothetical protein